MAVNRISLAKRRLLSPSERAWVKKLDLKISKNNTPDIPDTERKKRKIQFIREDTSWRFFIDKWAWLKKIYPYINPGTLYTYQRYALTVYIIALLCLGHIGIAILMLGFACLTDYLDGEFARSLSCESAFGSKLDPLADKFMLFLVGYFHWAIMAAIVSLELLGKEVSRMVRLRHPKHFIAPHSKVITGAQMGFLIILFTLFASRQFAVEPMITAVLAIISVLPNTQTFAFLYSFHDTITALISLIRLYGGMYSLYIMIGLSAYRVFIYSRIFQQYKAAGEFGDPDDRLLTIANFISASRMFSLSIFIQLFFSGQVAEAELVFVLACISDGLDGWAARKLKQVSKIGTRLDPAGDKLLIIMAAIIIIVYGSPFAVYSIISLFIFEILSGVFYAKMSKIKDQILWFSKAMTAAQGIAMSIIIAPEVFPLLDSYREWIWNALQPFDTSLHELVRIHLPFVYWLFSTAFSIIAHSLYSSWMLFWEGIQWAAPYGIWVPAAMVLLSLMRACSYCTKWLVLKKQNIQPTQQSAAAA